MARGTVRKTSTNWWAIVDADEQPLASFDRDDPRFSWAEPGALVHFEADRNDKVVSMTLATPALAARMRNFTATVKERDIDQPCFVVIELIAEPSERHIVLDLPAGTTIEDAQEIAQILNRKVARARIGLLR